MQEGGSRFMNYIRCTTTHGVVYIFTEPTWVRKIFWLIVVLLATAGCLYYCTGRIMYLVSKPSSTSISVDRQLELDFPAVTICNLNVFRKDYLRSINLDDFIRDSVFFNYQKENETALCLSQLKNISNPILANTSYQSLLENGKDSLPDLILDCEFQGGPCEVNSSYFVPSMTRYGICYTFNSGRDHRPILKAYGTGSRMGLRLTLNVNYSQYIATTKYDAGIKVAIHQQFSPPQADDRGIAIPTRRSAFISMEQYTTTDKTKQNCTLSDEVTDFNFLHGEYNYSYASCRMDCYYTHIANVCHCVLVNTFGVDDRNYRHLNRCMAIDLCCIMEQQSIGIECKCFPSCNVLDYDYSTSYSDLPEDYAVIETSQGRAEHVLTVNVYFKTLSIRRQVTSYSYDFGSLLSDIGGQLGLFLGISVISIMEFATWVASEINDRIFSKWTKKTQCCKPTTKKNDDERIALTTKK